MKNLYTLDMLEEIVICDSANTTVTMQRVPGGWVRDRLLYDSSGDIAAVTSAFIPYVKEVRL